MPQTTKVEAVACLSDNYAWLVTHEAMPGHAVVVDPGEAAPVLRALEQRGLMLDAIVITHHHHDHIGGIKGIVAAQQADATLRVLAGRYDVERCRVPHASDALDDGASFSLLDTSWHAIATPGHTHGATSYHVPDAECVFTGDTLFLSGCGRLIEGDAQTQYNSLSRFKNLPEKTRIYCGHEYTEKNLRFAASVLPNDKEIARAQKSVSAARKAHQPSVPGRIDIERKTNVFLRCEEQSVARAVGASPGLETFRALRDRRDRF